MKTIGIIASVAAAGIAIGVGYAINKHEWRGLRVGSKAATPEMMGHPSWEAVVSGEGASTAVCVSSDSPIFLAHLAISSIASKGR